MNQIAELLPYLCAASVLLAGAIGWGGHALMAQYREAKEIEAELEAEKVRRQRLENEYHLARHRVHNLNRQLARAKANKKRQKDILAARQQADAEFQSVRQALGKLAA